MKKMLEGCNCLEEKLNSDSGREKDTAEGL